VRSQCAVILAAGRGLRLRSMLVDEPKGFIEFGRHTLIERSIQQLQHAGIEDILIVTGYQSSRYEELVQKIAGVRIVENRYYESTGSLSSLALALPLVNSPFLLLESDLAYESRALTALVSDTSPSAVLVSGFTEHGDEVFVDGACSRLRLMSKDTSRLRAIVGEFVGISLVGTDAKSAIAEYAADALCEDPRLDYEEAFNAIAASHEISLCKVDDLLWTEIDDPQHLAIARDSVLPRLLEREARPGTQY